ncbi:hypothetical protein DFH11DRAFT_1512330 [Phellopilus nigrolimitatus]|nr:hypothetical protein DFH11DRAFT_1512330 [Phellopilus nigrolimitatus]
MASKDETFYFSMTIFQVEGCLFKVPRKPFEEQSEIFRSMFSLPQESNAMVEGMTDDKPLILDSVKKADFRAFLQVLFPPSYGEEIPLSEQEWLSVLGLANMWSFTKIRQTAIEKLQHNSIDLITKVELAHRYDIREWLYGAYLALGKRLDPLSVEESARLGYDFAIKMGHVRERLLRDKIAHPNAYRQRPGYIPARGDSPRSGARNGQQQPRMRTNLGIWSTHPFPGELEDEDDIVLSRAISDIFGVRGEAHFMLGDADLDQNDGIPLPNPQTMPWVMTFDNL